MKEVDCSMAAAIPVLHFDTTDFPESQRFEVWRAGITTHQVTRSDPSVAPFDAVVDAWTLGEMVMTHSRIGAARMVRTAEMAQQDSRDWILVLLLKSGTMDFAIDGGKKRQTMRQGEVAVFDTICDFASDGSAMDSITCAISRRAFAQITSGPSPHHGLILEGAWGRLVADYLLSLVRQLPDMDLDDTSNLTDAFVGLLMAGLRATQPAGNAPLGKTTATARQRVESYIDENLTSCELTSEEICNKLALSPSSLYRAFAHAGGITAYIRKRRLEVIHALLSTTAEGVSIGEIARQHGFVSAAHFSRAFRKQFGFSPRVARRATILVPPPAADADEVAIFRHWEEQLR
ncbi:helix-turn-helix domain-containing protein [Bradyrhizobium sp. 141]|uniref:helix-turn-helix domain-containing protein n=1 Tax=Bradyrhizobium sp. 141 TaxID=2782617 RepID=UPI001FFA5402|nr:helix-turn-helix domain-containing protein [Bradyrhizobium sp. 141]MCK1719898.1 helix-turn-helix domain-containing protein [Bradyrhizobium sp. 141]